MAAGASVERIASELGVSLSTAKRRMKEHRGGLAVARAVRRKVAPVQPTAAPIQQSAEEETPPNTARSQRSSLPEDVENVPEDTPLEQIDAWLKMAKEEADSASVDGEFETMAKMIRLAATLLTLKQKATPIAPPDPNEHPDMIAAAVRARKRLHTMANKLVFVAKSPLAESIGKLLKNDGLVS